MKLIIIGAGMSGMLASIANSQTSPLSFEASESPVSMGDHLAVMRFRDERVPLMLGAEYTSVLVKKAIFSEGKFFDHCNPRFNNLYSLKTTGQISSRSIESVEDSKRFIINEISKIRLGTNQISYGQKLVRIECSNSESVAVFKCGEKETRFVYDFCISTIPMPSILKATGQSIGADAFKCNPVWISKFETNTHSSVYQTIYFPDQSTQVYRASLEGKSLTIESMDVLEQSDEELACGAFGLASHQYTKIFSDRKKTMGKLVPIDSATRKSIICNLTDKFRIYSLGRYAIWKSIRSDEVVKDVEAIRAMMCSRYSTIQSRI